MINNPNIQFNYNIDQSINSTVSSTRSYDKTRGFISLLLNAVAALILLIGNSSFTILSYGQYVDSSKIVPVIETEEKGDAKVLKISTPSKKMIRQADIEITRNMNDLIKMINQYRMKRFDAKYSDLMINQDFYQLMYSIPFMLTYNIDDNLLHELFQAENIKVNEIKTYIESDFNIHHSFKSTLYIYQKYSSLSNADLTINNSFYTENP